MNRLGTFNASEEALAREMWEFRTCQRSDGSYYGTGGQCRKGTETDKVEKETKSKKSAGGGEISSSDIAKAAKAAGGFRGGGGGTINEDIELPQSVEMMSKKELKAEIKSAVGGMLEKNGAIYEAAPKELKAKLESYKIKDSDIKKVEYYKASGDRDPDDPPSGVKMMVFGREVRLNPSSTMDSMYDSPNYDLQWGD